MRMLACLVVVLAGCGCASAGRLENTYLPPAGAAQAGGANLATPFQGPVQQQSAFLAPSGLRAGSSGSNAFGSSSGSSSSSFSAASASSASSFGNAGRFGAQQAQQQAQINSLNSYSNNFQQPTPRPALIIKQVNENPGDGTYTFSYETENGIQAEERGQIRADGAEGLAAVQGAYAFTAPDNNVRYTVTYTADENGFLAYGDHLPTPPPVPAEIQRALEQNAADEARGLVDDGQYRAEHHGEQLQQKGAFLRGGLSSTGYSANAGSNSGFNANNGGNSGFNANSGSSSGSNSGYNSNGGYQY